MMAPKRKELTDFQRGRIYGQYEAGKTQTEIAAVLNIPRTTIRNVIAKPEIKPNARKGRPKLLTDRDKRRINLLISKMPKVTYKELLQFDFGVSVRTLRRYFKSIKMRKWIAKKRPFLTQEHARKRLAFALKHKDWSYEEWSKVIFSDECSVARGSGNKREWVFRTPYKKWWKEFVSSVKKGKEPSIMLWGAIWSNQKSDLYLLD